MKSNTFSPKKKDRIKIARGILQGVILIILLIAIIKALFSFSVYEPYNSSKVSNNQDSGFIAVSYFGVDRTGNDTLISTKRLDEQLKALKNNGYVTITQKDVVDYYLKGKALPPKSLFLLFEDGRRDTAIFSQKIIEEYNLKATMLTYADKFEKEDSKFLSSNELLELVDSSYWELGTNGYRLEYINVFDKDSNYLGNLNSVEFAESASSMERDYNHYLMDYIRDEYNIPKESYEEMKQRIDSDYKALSKVYTKEISQVPKVYALMHSNTGQFGTNDKVSEINGKWIKELFNMNFNREGFSLNTIDSSIYDLTRIQPQAYWSTNHLLMRIWDDTKQDIKFVIGDKEKASKFKEVSGKAEFKDDTIILTSLSEGKGILKLLNSDTYKDVKVSTILNGNIIGSQGIYLRANDDQSDSLCVRIMNNVISIIENSKGSSNVIFSLDLSKNKEEKFDIRDGGSRKVDITLVNDKISVDIDGTNIAKDLDVTNDNQGSIYLESAWGEYGYSQRNIADDVYDGVFKKFRITDVNDNELYDSSLKGVDSIIYSLRNFTDKIIDWFIKYL
ncbi:MAG: glycoside hydrolase [Clostridium sulfidigenes]|uniref:Glycoside hydrolase n=1 Tax=Clostridium sulfidigenes TaxID=318464 RepID=A0A927W5R0_9CLOT|nr:glycoside hydrolase [Clostridium sulfidigenes]